jgi:6-phosphogluconolactonase
MENYNWQQKLKHFDEKRDIIIPGDREEPLHFCVQQFLEIGREAIASRGLFAVALSGGQTPNAIFRKLSHPLYRKAVDWTKVLCFWSDERSVPPDHPESNYGMAMEAGLTALPLLNQHIFRMVAEKDIEEEALKYEQLIRNWVPSGRFDLMMLGVGEDGHTASLFPKTHALHAKNRLVVANHVPQKQTWRMSLTYECIHLSRCICIYALGKNKAPIVAQTLAGPYDPDNWPVQRVGTPHCKAFWILDNEAASQLC